jgi:hypothetical protein
MLNLGKVGMPHLNFCIVSEPTVEKNLQRHPKSVRQKRKTLDTQRIDLFEKVINKNTISENGNLPRSTETY